MKLPDEDKAVPNIARVFNAQFESAEKISEYVQKAAGGATPKGGVRLIRCLCGALARLLRLHYSAVKLTSVGVGPEAALPVRAMFELVVNLWALEQSADREGYACKWIARDLHNFMRSFEAELKVRPELGPKFTEYRKLADAVKREVDDTARKEAAVSCKDAKKVERRVKGEWEKLMKHGPSMVNLPSLANSVYKKSGGTPNFPSIYERAYRSFSGTAHGSDLASMASMFELSADKQIVLKLAPTEDDIEAILGISSPFLAMGSLTIFRVLDIGPANAEAEMFAILTLAMPKE